MVGASIRGGNYEHLLLEAGGKVSPVGIGLGSGDGGGVGGDRSDAKGICADAGGGATGRGGATANPDGHDYQGRAGRRLDSASREPVAAGPAHHWSAAEHDRYLGKYLANQDQYDALLRW